MARKKRSITKIIVVLGVLALAAFGAWKLYSSPDGQRVVKSAEAGGKAAAKAYKAGHRK